MNTLDSSEQIPQWLQLPSDFIIPEQRDKRPPKAVDFTELGDDQMEIAEVMMTYAEGKAPFRIYVLEGYAGVGKTFLTSKILDWLLYAKKLVVGVSAPTNKAVDVVREMSEVADPKLIFATLHKILALKENYDGFGRLYFTPDNNESPSIEKLDILFVDEVSQLDHKIFEYLNVYVERGLKIIFIGDPAQIPPVNRIDCIPFMPNMRKKYNMGVGTLTKIRRQAEGNPILMLATKIREDLTASKIDFDYKTDVKDGAGIVMLNRDDRAIIHKICDVYFANNRFEEYSDYMKVIAYRNKVVNAVNDQVRKIIYNKTELPAIMVGEKLLANSPIRTVEQNRFSTNSEMQVLGYEIRQTKVVCEIDDAIVFQETVKYYDTFVIGTQRSDKKNFNKKSNIWIMHEDSIDKFRNAMEMAKLIILKLDFFKRPGNWRKYYTVKEMFADVKYNYAITAHKCQGSSYQQCMILDWDIDSNTQLLERNRIKYVAVTRPRDYLFIVK